MVTILCNKYSMQIVSPDALGLGLHVQPGSVPASSSHFLQSEAHRPALPVPKASNDVQLRQGVRGPSTAPPRVLTESGIPTSKSRHSLSSLVEADPPQGPWPQWLQAAVRSLLRNPKFCPGQRTETASSTCPPPHQLDIRSAEENGCLACRAAASVAFLLLPWP